VIFGKKSAQGERQPSNQGYRLRRHVSLSLAREKHFRKNLQRNQPFKTPYHYSTPQQEPAMRALTAGQL
jgi:hypothetical protein